MTVYSFLKQIALKFIKVPPEPTDPLGGEGTLLVFRASPNYFKYKFYLWVIGSAIIGITLFGVATALLVGGGVAMSEGNGVLAFLLWVLALLLLVLIIVNLLVTYTTMRMDYELRWYKVTDRSLRIREGIWHVREMTMTFDNIQNISVTQGPLQRMLKIADVKVQTAGGGGVVVDHQGQQMEVFNMHLGYFRGVDNAEEIVRIMNERLRKVRGSGLGDHDDEADQPEAPMTAAASSAELVAAARALLDEARAFRSAAEALR
ncbi:MAG: hypothetical protein PWP23_2162 [Candidatus Sumerlaeota bacterium]|nr:hypothetical protein [Candidatus Sumerlaeota bacterium]